MIRYHPYFRRTVTSVLLLVSTLSQAQTLIEADTISFDCRDSYQQRSEKDKFAISSYEEYNESGFFARREYGCLPFENIDFDTSILVGFKYWELIVTNTSNGQQSLKKMKRMYFNSLLTRVMYAEI